MKDDAPGRTEMTVRGGPRGGFRDALTERIAVDDQQASAAVGAILGGTYRIERLLGSGSMGRVFEVSHLRLSRRFAVKLLDPVIANQNEILRRFNLEAEVTSRLKHPHIVDVVDFNITEDGQPFIVMELLEGENLAARLEREGRLPLQEVTRLFSQMADAMQAAHELKVVHRDLKPQNIFLARVGKQSDVIKVVDFGISKVMGLSWSGTRVSSLLGSPYYMSPELAQGGARDADFRTDIYSLAVIVYQALRGQPPFVAESIPAILYKIVHDEVPPLRPACPWLPVEAERVILKALHKDRHERFDTMEDFWRSFAAALSQKTPQRSTEQPSSGVAAGLAEAQGVAQDVASSQPRWIPVQTDAQTQIKSVQAGTMPGQPAVSLLRVALVAVFVLVVAGIIFRLGWSGDQLQADDPGDGDTQIPPVAVTVAADASGIAVAALPEDAAWDTADASSKQGEESADERHWRKDAGAKVAAVHRRDRPPPARRAAAKTTKVRRVKQRPAVTSQVSQKKTILVVSSLVGGQPLSAEVFLDGQRIGETPLYREGLPPGSHLVEVRRAGFTSGKKRVRLQPGLEARVVLRIEPEK